jgi:hypothetical protein
MLYSNKNSKDEIFKALKVSPLTSGNFVLLEDFAIDDIVIPKGYTTNGANIPRILWSIVPPFKVQNLPAVVVHDWLCDKKEYKEADLMFKRLLEKFDLEPFKNQMVYAVKTYHKYKYGVK